MFDFLRNVTKSAEEKRQEAVSAYLDGALTPVERRRFEQQLAQDPGLRIELEQQRRLQQALRQLPRRPVPRAFTLDPARYGRPQPQPLFRLYPVLQAATALTAVFFVVAVVLDLLTPPGAPSFTAAEPAPEAVSLAVEVTAIVTEEIVVEGEVIEVTRVVSEVVIEEEAAAEPAEEALAEAEEEAVEEEPAPAEDGVMTLEAAEDATGAILEETVAAPALPVTTAEIRPITPLPTPTQSDTPRLPATTTAPERVITESAPAAQANGEAAGAADEAPAEAARETDITATRIPPFSNFRTLQVALGVAFVLLAFLTYLVRRQL